MPGTAGKFNGKTRTVVSSAPDVAADAHRQEVVAVDRAGNVTGGGGGPVTIADGANVAQGTTTDAGIITDINGTEIGFLRGAIKQWISLLVQVGIITETAPGTDTASSGLNGRLQRVAQRITSLIALLPSALISNRLDVNLGA